jgi:hypothetical protein
MKFKILQTTASVLLMGSLVLAAPDVRAGHKYNAYCSQTTGAALTACQNDVKDNFWLTNGICINIADNEERRDCYIDARQEKREGMALCYEQREARDEVCDVLGQSRYDPEIDPANFVDPLAIGDTVATNSFMPLVAGLTRIYEAGDETITVIVTDETIVIQGVTCIVVRDTVEEDGEVIEDTVDWFAQDIYGNVWYFGEISRNYEDGMLDNLDGSWMAGKDGAKAGIVMKAAPQVGDVYRQEWALAEAEDMGEVVSIAATESAPAASCNGTCLLTRDFTPLEPDASEHKFYAPGIGVIVAYDVDDPAAREELVEYHY